MEQPKSKQTQNESLTSSSLDLRARVEAHLSYAYPTESETQAWQDWAQNMPLTDVDHPIEVPSFEACLAYLPPYGNPGSDKVNLFFKRGALEGGMGEVSILREASKRGLSYEISVIRHSASVISVGIGGKLRNASTLFAEGVYVGHYHPLGIRFEKPEILPEKFLQGLVPSPGDTESYHRFSKSLEEGTVITSPFGEVRIEVEERPTDLGEKIEEYRYAYFELFLGKSSLGWQTETEIQNYFRDRFGLRLAFDMSG